MEGLKKDSIFNEEQLQRIDAAIERAKNSENWIPHEQVMRKIREKMMNYKKTGVWKTAE